MLVNPSRHAPRGRRRLPLTALVGTVGLILAALPVPLLTSGAQAAPTAAVAATAAAATVTDLASDFETGTDGWSGNGVTAVQSTGAVAAHGGTGVLAISDKTGWGATLLDLRSVVQPGVTYTLSGYVRMASGSGAVTMTTNDQVDGGYHNTGSYAVPVSDTGWTRISQTYSLPAEAPAQNPLQVYFELQDFAPFFLDDFTVTHEGASTTPGTDLESGFEDGTTQGWNGASVTAASVTDAAAHGGARLLAVTDTTAGWGAVIHDLKSVVQAGVTYTLTAYVRVPTGTGKVSMTVQQDGDYQNSGTYQVAVDDSGWTKLTRTYTLPAGAPAPSTLQVYFEAADDLSTFWVDDVTVTHSTGGGTPSAMPLSDTFEDGATGAWAPRGPVTLANSTDQAHAGTHSLLTTGRTANWNGPSLSLTGKVTEGKEHSISLWVRMASGTDTVRITIEKQAEGVDSTYTTVGSSAAVTDGAWTRLSGTWTAPADATALTLYVEGDAAESSYLIDDFAMDEVTTGTLPGQFQHDFEDGSTQGWTARGGPEAVTNSTAVAHGGTHSLAVTGRTQSWNAPVFSVLGRFELGVTYQISAWVRLAAGAAPTTTKITMERRLNETPTYEGLTPDSAVTASGWTQLTGSYTLATEVDFLKLYVETPGTEDFFVDDVVVTSAPTLPVETDKPSLGDAFAAYWPHTGAAVSLPDTVGRHATLLKKHFTSITAGNAMKWDSIEHTKGVKNYAEADQLVAFAQANDIGVYGHVLAWHSQMPDWVFQDDEGNPLPVNAASKQLVLDRLADRVREIVGRYKGKVYAWDAANEVISDSPDETYRSSKYYTYTGLDFIRTAFRVARETDPAAQLCINDYNTTEPVKRDKYLALVEQLLAEGVPLDCVGHQMHVHMDGPPATEVDEALSRFETLGVRQRITELDVSVYPRTDDTSVYPSVPAENIAAQKDQYVALFSTFLAHARGIDSVTMWGLADDRTWLLSFPITRLNTPLLFDVQLQTKPVFDAVAELARTWTPTTTTTTISTTTTTGPTSPVPTTTEPTTTTTEPTTTTTEPTTTTTTEPTTTTTTTTTEPTTTTTSPPPAPKRTTITPLVILRDNGTASAVVGLSGGWCLTTGAKAVAVSKTSPATRVTATFVRLPAGFVARLPLGDRAPAGQWDVYVDGKECSGATLRPPAAEARLGSFRVLVPTALTLDGTPEPVRKGTTLSLAGTLRRLNHGSMQGYQGAAVVLEFRASGVSAYVPVATVTTGTAGQYSLRVTASKSGTWRARFVGTGDLVGSIATDAVRLS